jgi:hypothetical protein
MPHTGVALFPQKGAAFGKRKDCGDYQDATAPPA